MNRDDFQKISKLRVREAKALHDKGFFSGAYYLLGYAVECGFKACIASNINRYDFPPKHANNFYTHNLENLLGLSGLKTKFEKEMKRNKKLADNWSTVKDWKEDSRYRVDIDKLTSRDFYSAVTARKNGVLTWLKKYW